MLTNPGVCIKHWRTLFKKHVLPTLCSPAPIEVIPFGQVVSMTPLKIGCNVLEWLTFVEMGVEVFAGENLDSLGVAGEDDNGARGDSG